MTYLINERECHKSWGSYFEHNGKNLNSSPATDFSQLHTDHTQYSSEFDFGIFLLLVWFDLNHGPISKFSVFTLTKLYKFILWTCKLDTVQYVLCGNPAFIFTVLIFHYLTHLAMYWLRLRQNKISI